MLPTPMTWTMYDLARRLLPLGAVAAALAGASSVTARPVHSPATTIYHGTSSVQTVTSNVPPRLLYSSYLGGNSDEQGRGMTRDAAGNVYVTGYTHSSDFGGGTQRTAGFDDAFVAKFDASGKPIYRTLIGGSGGDSGMGIAVNTAGEVAVTVYTNSENFPLRNPLVSRKPTNDGAVIKLDAAGKLVFSTYLNVEFQQAQNIAFAPNGNIVFTGQDWAGNDGAQNVGIYIIDGSTFKTVQFGQYGGRLVDYGAALAVGADGKIYIGGVTESGDEGFPVDATAFQSTCGAMRFGGTGRYCDSDAFVSVLNPTATEVLYTTYLGGEGMEDVTGIGVDGVGNVYVTGMTYAQNFPTKNAFQPRWLGGPNFSNTYLTKFSPDLTAQRYSTYFASSDDEGSEYTRGIWVDASGNAAIVGFTNGRNLPVKHAIQDRLDGRYCVGSTERYCDDGFVAVFDQNGGLSFSSYLGGNADDAIYAITGDGAGGFWLTGTTEAETFPVTAGAVQPRPMPASDSFLTHIGTAMVPPQPQPGQQPYRVTLPLIVR